MTDLWYYNGRISWDYEDIEQSIIDFQLATGVISSKSEDGAGWFGPKTRAVAKVEYRETRKVWFDDEDEEEDTQVIQQEVTKVSRENMLTREEIEAKEMEDFLRTYDVEIKSEFSQIKKWETKISIFSLADRKGKEFRWNTPGKVTFSYDTSKINIFPESFFNFTNGERELTITGLAIGHTTVDVKIWEVIVGKLSITVGNPWEKASVESSKLYGTATTALWEEKTAVVLMKDKYGNKLLKTNYDGTFTLESDSNVLYCIKNGAVENVRNIYKQDCASDEYKSSITFNYSDTVWGLLIFDYKVLDDTGKIKINTTNKNLLSYNMNVTWVKNLTKDYAYYNEVVSALKAWLINGVDRGYFSQDNELLQEDAKDWIISAMKLSWGNREDIQRLEKQLVGKFDTMTRKSFLALTSEYLGNNVKADPPRDYRDMEEKDEVLVSSILGPQYSWKDDFWEKYFQPDKKITRWEAVYLLTKALENTWNGQLVRK